MGSYQQTSGVRCRSDYGGTYSAENVPITDRSADGQRTANVRPARLKPSLRSEAHG
jgi:hypothetical protein